MTESARTDAASVDWSLWLPGVTIPLACFVVDYIAGEHILRLAPAPLLSLAAVDAAFERRFGASASIACRGF